MRKLFLISFLLISIKPFAQTTSSYHYLIPEQRNDGLQTASLLDVGIDSNKIIDLTNKILSNTYINIHSLVILRQNKLVYENYFGGPDEILVFGADNINQLRGKSAGPSDSPIDSLHDLRSVSKSIVSACIGIAIAQRKIKNEDQNIWDYFPNYHELDTGMKSTITIKDLLTMTSGLDWNETNPSYTDSVNSETQMDKSVDQIRFVLTRNSVDPPGTNWNYSGGNTQLLGAIIKKVSGLEVDEFAKKYLFTPLGITHFSWTKFRSTSTIKGAPAAASGLRLSSRDMAKFGLLYVNNGKWEGKQIISADWIQRSLQYHFTAFDRKTSKTYYGYQFWAADANISNSTIKAFGALGNGGQCIIIVPSIELVIVVTAGNYNMDLSSYDMIAKEIYPAIEIKKTK